MGAHKSKRDSVGTEQNNGGRLVKRGKQFYLLVTEEQM